MSDVRVSKLVRRLSILPAEFLAQSLLLVSCALLAVIVSWILGWPLGATGVLVLVACQTVRLVSLLK